MVEGIQPKTRTTLYIDPNIWKEFKKICGREEESMSEKLEKFCARYIAIHQKGNPQLRLEPFIGEVKKVCYCCEGLFPFLNKVRFISGLKACVCDECMKEYEERRLVKKKLGIT